MREVVYLRPVVLFQAHFKTWYEIWEWPGAELDLFLKMASRISSGVISEYGRSSGSLAVRSGWKSCSRLGGGW